MNHTSLRVGVVGSGFGALVHVPAFRLVEGVSVVGLASRNPEHASKAAAKLGVSAFPDVQSLINSPDIDIVSVAVPPAEAGDIIACVIALGKHVLAEKPLGGSLTEAESLLQKAEHAGIAHAVNFQFRELPVLQELRRRLTTGECGTLRHVEVRWITGGWANPNRPWGWQSDARGGGVLSALLVHLLDQVEWLCGPLVRLTATVGTAIEMRSDGQGSNKRVTAPDHCSVIALLADGATVTICVSNVAPQGTGHWIDIHGSTASFCAGSSVLTNFGTGYQFRTGKPGEGVFHEIPVSGPDPGGGSDGRIAPTAELMRRFAESIRTGDRHFEPSFVVGVRTRFLLEAVARSHAESHWVDTSPSA